MRQRVVGRHALIAALGLGLGVAAAADDTARRRQAIEAGQAEVQARHEQAVAACRQRFDVNACLQQARQRQRQALAALDAERRALDEAARRQRADARLADAERRQAEVARRAAAASTAAPAPASPVAGVAATAPAPAALAPRAPASGRSAPPQADRAARAAERAAAAQRLQDEIRADQARIQQRVDKRAAKGKPVAPLPPVPGASAAR